MAPALVTEAWGRWGPDLIRFLREIVAIRSLSGREEEAARRVRDEMQRLGLSGARLDRWGNALGDLPGEGRRRILLNAHLDVVSAGEESAWSHRPFGGEMDGERIYGRGVCDTKGAVACQVYAAAALREAGAGLRSDLAVAQVVMEEVGGVGTLGLLEDGGAPDAALVGEPSDGLLRFGHRGRVQVEVAFHGRAYHAAVAGAGANPHWAEAAFLGRLRDLPLPEDEVFGTASIEPTLVRTDNESPNVVPETCRLTLDCRTLPGQGEEEVLGALRPLLEASVGNGVSGAIAVPRVRRETWTGLAREMPDVMPSFATDPDDPLVVEAARALGALTGEAAPVRPWLFATDGGHLAAAGARVIGFGPGPQERAHIVDEHLGLEELRLGFEGTLACILAMDEALHAGG